LDGPISKARCHPRFVGIFAFGGKEVNLEIWNSSSGPSHHLRSFLPIWSAKNVRNDEYNLKQPIWISDLHFLDEQHRPLDLGFLVAVCTRFHQVHTVIWILLMYLNRFVCTIPEFHEDQS
jgi:hypothetical protein